MSSVKAAFDLPSYYKTNYSVIDREALSIYWGVKKHYQYLMGNSFILCSDHKPLLALFGENKGIPQMAAGRLQRWAFFLSGFDYRFQHIKGSENGGADGLSRFPIKEKEDIGLRENDYFNFLVEDNIPVRAEDIKREWRTDSILSKVFLYTRDGWPDETLEIFKPFKSRRLEISIENGILMWGYRVIIPEKFRAQLLQEIHGAHNGMVKMKMLVRQYFWWPGLDGEIENFVKNCEACMTYTKNPNKVPLIKFDESKHVFDRIHLDFLGPIRGKTFLIITDAYSKWPEVYEMIKTDTESTIEKLRDCFSRYGLPNTLISDNGPQLVRAEFENFCSMNGIKHVTSPPYHPATNGAAENSVKSFKSALLKLLKNLKQNFSTLICKYLFSYRNTPHCVTGETPSKLMFSRKVKTRLDFLTNSAAEKAREDQIKFHKGNRIVIFEEGETIYTKDYRNINKPIWVKAIVVGKLGKVTYVCKPLTDTRLQWKRHVDQMVKVGKFYEEAEMTDLDKDKGLMVTKSIIPDLKGGRECESSEISLSGKEKVSERPEVLDKSDDIVISDEFKDMVILDKTNDVILDKSDQNMETVNNPLVINRPRRFIKPPNRLNL